MNSPTNPDNILSPEEIKDLVYNSNSQRSEDTKAHDLDKFKKVENPKFPFFSRSIPKLFIVGILACPIFLLALIITSDFRNPHQTAAQTLSDDATDEQLEKDNELLKQQLDELQVQNAILLQDFEDLQAKKDQVKVIKTKSPPEPVQVAQAEVKPKPVKPKPVESVKPTPKPVIDPIDPYEEWNRYASIGVINGDGFTDDELNLEPETKNIDSGQTALSNLDQDNDLNTYAPTETSDSSDYVPVVSLGHTEPKVNHTQPNRLQEDNFLSQDARNALFPKSYDHSFLDAKRREYEQQDAANPKSESEQPTETFLEKKRKEYEQQDANSNLVQAQSTTSNLQARCNTALQARCGGTAYPSERTNSYKNVKLGFQITGELSQSISWLDGEQPQIRGVINLSEDLLANDNSIALPANSSIIVEVEPHRNGLINLHAIAISYENDQGQLVQQHISPETFVIQDEDNSPLIVKEKAISSEIISQSQDTVFDLIGKQSGTARRVIREVDDLNYRSNFRPETLELKQGTELTITVNSFLQINK